MTAPIEMQDVTQRTYQTVYALAIRRRGGAWDTVGFDYGESPAISLDYWRSHGYEARLLTALMPVETKP